MEFDHVVMATGHDWPENTETSPGYFSSPWPEAAIKRIGPVNVGVLGTSLSGIDGRLYFHDDATNVSETKEALISVKGGGVTVSQVRDLRGTVEREEAAIGALI